MPILTFYHFEIYKLYISYETPKICFIIHYFAGQEREAEKFKLAKFTCLKTDGYETRVQAF